MPEDIASSLRDDLTDWADIQTSEKNLSDTGTLDGIILNALLLHNDQYTLETLPAKEREPVLTLAWVKVCYIRASKFAREAGVSGGNGFGQNRDTPYYKNTALAQSLMARYKELCADLNIPNSKSSIHVSNIKVRDTRLDALVPLLVTENLPLVIATLSDPEPSSDYLILTFTFDYFTDYGSHYVYSLEGTTPIFQNWNYASKTEIPYINESATQLIFWTNPQVKALKIVGVDKTQNFRYLVAVRSRAEQYAYSNEVVFPLPTP